MLIHNSSFDPIDFLLCCARTNLNAEITRRIHFLAQQNFDWGSLLKTAHKHKILPIVYRNLKRTCHKMIPKKVLEQFRLSVLANSRRNVILTRELLNILNLFKKNDILAVSLKGPVLSQYVYNDITLRQFSDLDILVHPDDVSKAKNLLMARGYRPSLKIDEKQLCAYLKTEHALTFFHDKTPGPVDLHWKLTGGYFSPPLHIDFFKSRLELTNLENEKVYFFSPEDLVMQLCINGSLHYWESLELICCVSELIRSVPSLNWYQALQMTGNLHCQRMFFLGLFLARDLLAADIPEKMADLIKDDPKIRDLSLKVYRNLFHKQNETAGPKISKRFSVFHIDVRERYSDKFRHVLLRILRPTKEDWKRFPLPGGISFLLYLLRPIRLGLGLFRIFLRQCHKTYGTLSKKYQKKSALALYAFFTGWNADSISSMSSHPTSIKTIKK